MYDAAMWDKLDRIDDRLDRIENTMCEMLAEKFVRSILSDKELTVKLEEKIAKVFMEKLEELD